MSDLKPKEAIFKQIQELKIASIKDDKWELSEQFETNFKKVVNTKPDMKRQKTIARVLIQLIKKDSRFRKYKSVDKVSQLALAYLSVEEHLKMMGFEKPSNFHDCLLAAMYLDKQNPEVENDE